MLLWIGLCPHAPHYRFLTLMRECAAVVLRLVSPGTVTIDLYTLATGPVRHDLPIYDGLRTNGRLMFEVEMVEIKQVMVAHRDVRLSIESGVPPAGSGGTTLKMWYTADPLGIRRAVTIPYAAMIPDAPRVR